MKTATKTYLLENSPLKTTRGKWELGIVLFVIFVFAVLGRNSINEGNVLLASYGWLFYTMGVSLISFLIIHFFNRKRSILLISIGVVAFVAFQSSFVAAFLNSNSPAKLATVGFIEEFVKILPALLLVRYLPNVIRTKKDAMIYGALGGLGFNIIEVGIYLAQAMHTGVPLMGALYLHSTRLAFFGFGVHMIWSMFVGLGLGLTVESTKKGFRKWLPFIAIYLLIAISHSAYDSGLIGIFLFLSIGIVSVLSGKGLQLSAMSLEDTMKPGITRNAMVIEHYVYNILYLCILVVVFIKSAKSEQTIYVSQLADEDKNIVTAEEQKILAKESRWGFRNYPHFPKKISKRIVKLQNFLAIEKAELHKRNIPYENSLSMKAIRSEIAQLRV